MDRGVDGSVAFQSTLRPPQPLQFRAIWPLPRRDHPPSTLLRLGGHAVLPTSRVPGAAAPATTSPPASRSCSRRTAMEVQSVPLERRAHYAVCAVETERYDYHVLPNAPRKRNFVGPRPGCSVAWKEERLGRSAEPRCHPNTLRFIHASPSTGRADPVRARRIGHRNGHLEVEELCRQFGHELREVERVVGRTPRFVVIEKRM